jgi:RNA polymerase sigma-70 factor (sigma-E family)
VPDGRETSFRAFVDARAPALLRTAYLLTGDRHLAQDLLQTTLLKSYLRWHHIADPAATEAYVRRILIRSAATMFRRRSAGERPSGVLPEVVMPDHTSAVHDRTEMWPEVLRLPARQRAVVVLRFYEDLSEADTAHALGCSRGAVKTHTSRAIATLRRRLGAALDEETTR